MPNCRVRVVDEDEQDVDEGQEGELLISSPTVMQGYYKNQKATSETFTKDGLWFKTGDIGIMRGRLLYIIDRKKVSCHISSQGSISDELSTHTVILCLLGTYQVQGSSSGTC
jgi:long-subunit acyl-CoA synthetase (AMP-forming)